MIACYSVLQSNACENEYEHVTESVVLGSIKEQRNTYSNDDGQSAAKSEDKKEQMDNSNDCHSCYEPCQSNHRQVPSSFKDANKDVTIVYTEYGTSSTISFKKDDIIVFVNCSTNTDQLFYNFQ